MVVIRDKRIVPESDRIPQCNKSLVSICEAYERMKKYPDILDNIHLKDTWNDYKLWKSRLIQYKKND